MHQYLLKLHCVHEDDKRTITVNNRSKNNAYAISSRYKNEMKGKKIEIKEEDGKK